MSIIGGAQETAENNLRICDPAGDLEQQKQQQQQQQQLRKKMKRRYSESDFESEVAARTDEDEVVDIEAEGPAVDERDEPMPKAESGTAEAARDTDADDEEYHDEAEKSTASPCSVPEPCAFRTPPPMQQQQQQSSASGGESLPQSELLGKLPQSAASCSSSHSVASVEVERSCMETRGLVNVKWDITRKNKTSIVIDGYKMTESRAGKDGRVFWRCSKRFCSATAISLGPRLLSVRQVDARRFHNHPPTGKEEFFRGDFGSPGTPTQVIIKWPVTRLSVSSSDAAGSAAAADKDSAEQSAEAAAGLSLKSSALLRRRRERRRQQQLSMSESGGCADGRDSVLNESAVSAVDAGDDDSRLSPSNDGAYRDSSLLLGSFAKRARHESLEDLASIQQRLSDSLGGPAAAAALDGVGSDFGDATVSSGGAGGLQALAAAAGLHSNFQSSHAVSATNCSTSTPPMPLMRGMKSMPVVSEVQLMQQQEQQQQQQQQQQHQQTVDSQTQKALLALVLSGSLGSQQQLQPQQQQQLGFNPSAPYNPIFNPPPPPPPQQPPSLFSLAATNNNNHSHSHSHSASTLLSNGLGSHSSPLKEALSQIDNSQLRRQLRRLESYFRAGIVSMSEAIFRHTLPSIAAAGSKVTPTEQDCLVRLFNYMEGLERVNKLAHELV